MEFIGRRKIFLIIAFLLITTALFADEDKVYMEDPLSPASDTSWGNRSRELRHAIDTQNCGKGCGALLSHNAHFVMNPAAMMINKMFSVTALYQFVEAMSVSVSDSKTTVVGGGIMYSYNYGLHHIKTNFGFPIWPGFIYGGINLNNYIGKFAPTQNKDTNSHSFDVGIVAQITPFVNLGFAALDVWTFYGRDIPRKLSWNFETNIRDMFFINTGWQYHLQQGKEKFTNKRTTLKGFDFYTGLEFRYSMFRAGLGFNNISSSKKLTWYTTTKTFSLAFYKPGAGGIYGNFMYNESNYITFSINVVWEPSVGE
ncbi:hypothetical protein J6W78_03485 [bacterium]|nr:hypothetical protein [bacterium]